MEINISQDVIEKVVVEHIKTYISYEAVQHTIDSIIRQEIKKTVDNKLNLIVKKEFGKEPVDRQKFITAVANSVINELLEDKYVL